MLSQIFFQDRSDAARQLAKALSAYSGKYPLILAIPRGAVPIGKIIAEQLEGELDVVLSRKLTAPYNSCLLYTSDAADE